DLANVIYTIIQRDKADIKNQIYHFSNEGVCSWYDFAVAINEVSEHNCNIQPCHSDEFPSKVKRPSFSVLDKTKIRYTLGVEIPYWRESMLACFKSLISPK
ncbi:MAG: sugar nucleotide-binding protein, partial [Bacteroidales bacterium]|nr:sugar nucleotide-binding protein [Bacteroidales bacterium]